MCSFHSAQPSLLARPLLPPVLILAVCKWQGEVWEVYHMGDLNVPGVMVLIVKTTSKLLKTLWHMTCSLIPKQHHMDIRGKCTKICFGYCMGGTSMVTKCSSFMKTSCHNNLVSNQIVVTWESLFMQFLPAGKNCISNDSQMRWL